MRLQPAVPFVVAGAVALAACNGEGRSRSDNAATVAVPTAVHCADAPQLRERAFNNRRQSDESNSEQEKIVAGSRATFYASLAIIADLKCQVTLADADESLKRAFDSARKAEATRSFYESVVLWSEAGFTVTQVIQMLMEQVPAQRSE